MNVNRILLRLMLLISACVSVILIFGVLRIHKAQPESSSRGKASADYIYEELMVTQSTENKDPRMVLLLTTPRSGSSWTGRFLSQLENSFYLFEPLHYYDDQDFSSGVDLLQQLYQCGMSGSFSKYVHKWQPLYSPGNCNGPECKTRLSMIKHCLSADYRIMKVIRLRLGLVEKLLSLKTFKNLKVIFLTRDPRGTVNSYTKFREVASWPLTDEDLCAKIRDDVVSYKQLSRHYPKNLFFLRYEDISRFPFEKATELYNFIHDTQTRELPNKWKQVLENQMAMDESKMSLKKWESWRSKITPKIFEGAASNCDDIFEELGYRQFSSFQDLHLNPLVSSLAKEKCSTIPC